MAEESTGDRKSGGRAMIIALLVVAVLFVTQTWFASALAAGTIAFSDDDVNNAFFLLVAQAAGSGWATAFLAVNVVAVGIANAVAAQAATSRLLYSMSRDRRLPAFLSKVNARQVPLAAILSVSAISLVLVLFFVGQIAVISSLVNFGALLGFLLLHVSVAVYYLGKKKSKNYLLHLVVPVIGFLIIGYVLLNADITAKVGGILWLVVGGVVYAVFARRNGGATGPCPSTPPRRPERAAARWPRDERHPRARQGARPSGLRRRGRTRPARHPRHGRDDLLRDRRRRVRRTARARGSRRPARPDQPGHRARPRRGRDAGDALAVHVHEIRLGPYGWSQSLPGAGALQHRMPDRVVSRRIPIDAEGVHLTDRHVVAARPMIGCIGTAPAAGVNSTVMPTTSLGGNMDLTDVAPGATVYLPVEVEGALLSIGDIHAVMARGESSFVAIEAAGVAVVSIDLVKDAGYRAPRVETADEWIFVGLGDPVQESIRRGYEDVFDTLVGAHGWDAMDAYAVMSAVVHSELGGPTGSTAPDPLHPFRAVGAVTLHRLPKDAL